MASIPSRVTDGDTRDYTTEELRFQIICLPFFGQFPKVYSNEILNQKKRSFLSPAGNWTPVSRVTGGDTHHYTTEELHA